MTDLIHFLADCPVITRHRPWPRAELGREAWTRLAERLAGERWEVAALWGEPDQIHAALRDPDAGLYVVVSCACPDGRYLSLARVRPSIPRLRESSVVSRRRGPRPAPVPRGGHANARQP